ncbi:hypothetical protein MPSEU_000788100 [Mayamaea pseudoterrestris]|nr:hypothetical protein MPSEU_000788100 [Mayamaea pseudoterrestris]
MMNHAYRGAVALNNIGCSLMEKGCHSQAKATFRDVIVLLKIASSGQSDEGAKKVDQTVHRAMQRMTKPRRDSKELGMFVIVSDDACSSAFVHDHGSIRVKQTTLIRIEDYGRENQGERDLEIDSCIALQNYAASLLCSSNVRKSQDAKSSSPSARKLLRLCLTMLSKRYEQTMAAAEADNRVANVTQCHCIMAVAYVATCSLVQATLLKRQQQQADPSVTTPSAVMAQNHCCQHLQKLHQQLQLLDCSSGGGPLSCTSRGAAAA